MCGPLVLVMQGGRKWWHFLLYHFGRIISYLSIGFIFGILGKVISLTVLQQGISIISGFILLLFAGLFYLPLKMTRYGIFSKYVINGHLFQKLKSSPVFIAIPAKGILNGLLPCGMVYLAAAASLQGGQVSFALLYMLLFGLGTIPAMIAIFGIKNLTGFKKLSIFPVRKLAPYVAVLIGCLFILRGLAMDIPYLSPKINISENHQVKSCCEKK
jgi:sulfite exporter TauE/SafE